MWYHSNLYARIWQISFYSRCATIVKWWRGILGTHALSGHTAKRQYHILHAFFSVSQNQPVQSLNHLVQISQNNGNCMMILFFWYVLCIGTLLCWHICDVIFMGCNSFFLRRKRISLPQPWWLRRVKCIIPGWGICVCVFITNFWWFCVVLEYSLSPVLVFYLYITWK